MQCAPRTSRPRWRRPVEPFASAARETSRDLLRKRRCGQDHDRRGARAAGRGSRAEDSRSHDRPGPQARRRAGRSNPRSSAPARPPDDAARGGARGARDARRHGARRPGRAGRRGPPARPLGARPRHDPREPALPLRVPGADQAPCLPWNAEPAGSRGVLGAARRGHAAHAPRARFLQRAAAHGRVPGAQSLPRAHDAAGQGGDERAADRGDERGDAAPPDRARDRVAAPGRRPGVLHGLRGDVRGSASARRASRRCSGRTRRPR
jgi:hypothetical protein